MRQTHLIDNILSIFSEKKCYQCEKPGYYFCPECLQRQEKHKESCYFCKKFSPKFALHQSCKKTHFSHLLVLFHYRQGVIKKLLWDAKYYKKYAIYKDFSEIAAVEMKKIIGDIPESQMVITYPSMHFFRKIYRRYNHAEVFAKYVGEKLHVPVKKLLQKKTYTPHQSHLGKEEREKNLQNTFQVSPRVTKDIKDKYIILIDDVVSTAATLEECSKELILAGAKDIFCLAIASD